MTTKEEGLEFVDVNDDISGASGAGADVANTGYEDSEYQPEGEFEHSEIDYKECCEEDSDRDSGEKPDADSDEEVPVFFKIHRNDRFNEHVQKLPYIFKLASSQQLLYYRTDNAALDMKRFESMAVVKQFLEDQRSKGIIGEFGNIMPLHAISASREPGTSMAWDHIFKLKNPIKKGDTTYRHVCILCDATRPIEIAFEESLVALYVDQKGKAKPINGTRHLQVVHKLSMKDNNSTLKDSETKQIGASKVKAASSSSHEAAPSAKRKLTNQSSLDNFVTASKNTSMDHLHSLAVDFIVENNLPLSVVQSDSFNELMTAASKGSYKPLGPFREKRIIDCKFVDTFDMISDKLEVRFLLSFHFHNSLGG